VIDQLGRRLAPFIDIFRTFWENRDQLGFAWNILEDGVCDGCALGTTGMKDWTIDGIHLCWIRLNLLRLNTMPAFDPSIMKNISALPAMSEKKLRQLGRLSVPMMRERGEMGFRPISWNNAIDLISDRIRKVDPKKIAAYIVSRGTTNETYYVAQKVFRYLGTNHIDNSARVCHSPSTVALKKTIGFASSTCSYKDLIGTDLIILVGSNVANNQPVMMKYIHMAKKQGTKIVTINPYREPGLEKYWVPSSLDSVLFGTQVTDKFFQINVGGDIAFINGVLKHLVANEWIDTTFIKRNTKDWNKLVRGLDNLNFDDLKRDSGTTSADMLQFARIYAEAKTAVFVWSMGVTMHRFGVSNIKSIVNLCLARGMIGRPKTGLMAIRGHSGVQGGAEMGAVPNQFPGGLPINHNNAHELKKRWGFDVPTWKGYYAAEMVDAAHRGEIDLLYCIGSNLFNILPDSHYVHETLQQIPFRVHHDIVLNPQMLVDPGETVIILPATTRYEMSGGNTETTTERRIIFNPEIPGRRIRQARDEWRVLVEIAKRTKPDLMNKIDFNTTQQIRKDIALSIPFYNGIQNLSKKGDQFQWGGERLCDNGKFGTTDGKAHFELSIPPKREIPSGWFQLTTRRGKQFNSMKFGSKDPSTGRKRDELILSSQDMIDLGIHKGDEVMVCSETGALKGNVSPGPIQPGTVMMYWPEANSLIRRGDCDPECGIPAYRDEIVRIKPILK